MAINDNTAKWRVTKLGNIIGSNGYWQPNKEVKVGTIRFPMGEDNIGYVLECVEAGTTGEEQPTLIGEELANYAEVGRVGQVRVIFNLAEKDVDEVMAMGITYSRLTYPELWNWAGKRAGLVISEEEWQAKFAETNGKFVPYYSSGDGSSTFRTPLLGAYLKGAETSSEVGKWLDAGLPNITGTITTDDSLKAIANGAFEFTSDRTGAPYNESDGLATDVSFDASRSSSIYGNSDTVTPETMTGIWVIKAVGVVVDSGETDIAQVLTATEQVQERVSAVEDNHKIKTFTSLAQLGLANTCTPEDIAEAMPPNSKLLTMIYGFSDDGNPINPNIGVNFNSPMIVAKTTDNMADFKLCRDGGVIYSGVYAGWASTKFSGWKRLAHNDALSMPSDNILYISIPTFSNTSDWAINHLYIAPADGWLNVSIMSISSEWSNEASVRAAAGTEVFYLRTVLRNTGDFLSGTIPCRKGQSFYFQTNKYNMVQIRDLAFIYAQSEV